MNKIIPIANFVVSIIAAVITISGLIFAALTKISTLFGAFAIVIIVIGFTVSAINCGIGFAFTKSKLCIASGIISALSLLTNIAAFIILI